jgi:ribonuclease R
LGDRVEVQVKSVDYYRQQIDLLAVGGGSEASEDDDDLASDLDDEMDSVELEAETSDDAETDEADSSSESDRADDFDEEEV